MESRQIALKYAFRAALGGTSKLRTKLLLATLRRRRVGRTKRPSVAICARYVFADPNSRRRVTIPPRADHSVIP